MKFQITNLTEQLLIVYATKIDSGNADGSQSSVQKLQYISDVLKSLTEANAIASKFIVEIAMDLDMGFAQFVLKTNKDIADVIKHHDPQVRTNGVGEFTIFNPRFNVHDCIADINVINAHFVDMDLDVDCDVIDPIESADRLVESAIRVLMQHKPMVNGVIPPSNTETLQVSMDRLGALLDSDRGYQRGCFRVINAIDDLVKLPDAIFNGILAALICRDFVDALKIADEFVNGNRKR